MERELSATGSLTTFSTRVVAVSDLTPNLRLVELEGGLEGFESLGSEQFAYLFVPRPGVADVPEGYTMADFMATDPAARPWGAYYTVRTWDPDRGRISLWIVTHGHGDGVGGWAATCRVGERVALWGPREPFRPPEGTTSYLLVADESGLAAVAVMLEERPRATPATVIVETVDEDHRVDLRVSGAVDDVVDVRWRYRGDDAPGTGSRLLDAVRALDLDVDGLAAFGAAESRQVTAIRKYLRHERGMAPEQVSMTGYWRRD
jgi:NADPH-dependent ferric siderophore reductase